MNRYNPKDIEPKWQKIWDETGTYTTDFKSSRPKYFAMSMFNYPSGAGIHIGHAMNYTISDVKARFKRQQGFESYHPVGWDAFGLPAENYAIKTGVSPQESMANIIPDYHKQYKAMGWSNDWEKEIATHLPEYYKWSQWLFEQLYKNGLVYQDSRMQWYCEIDNTVLANEQVIDGKCWRHDGPDDPPAEKREVRQWFFKITDFADELLEATDSLDWSESVKLAQRNWIGKSVGAEILFNLDIPGEPMPEVSAIRVFTTRPDTLYGATFIVVAPDHKDALKLASKEKSEDVRLYIDKSLLKTEVQRQESKEKTGAFTGTYALNPINGQKLPVFIADYVLGSYGTGAIMAVPAHDERDWEFAKKYDLPVVRVVQNDAADDECSHDEGIMINSGDYNGKSSQEVRELIVRKLAELKAGTEKVNYRMNDWSVSRQRYWGAPIPIIHCPKDGAVLVPEEQLPVVLPEIDNFAPAGDGRSALARAEDWLQVACPVCGGPAERETDTMDTYVDSSFYFYRYLDPHNQHQLFDSAIVKKWEPVDFYNGADHATAHLLYARFIGHFLKSIGLVDEPEPFKQFLFNGKVTASDGTMFSKSKGNGVDPLDIINQGYGADALRTYLMFAAPLELWAKWDPQGVPATHRFISRVWKLVGDYIIASPIELNEKQANAINRATHRMIKKVTTDIEANHYNTAIAGMMECTNDLYKLKAEVFGRCEAWQAALNSLVACMAPFAPHAAEELWHQMGHSLTVHRDSWPVFDEKYLTTDKLTIVAQINGKVRAQIELPADTPEADIVKAARDDSKIKEHIAGREVKKTIFVAGKLVNFVV